MPRRAECQAREPPERSGTSPDSAAAGHGWRHDRRAPCSTSDVPGDIPSACAHPRVSAQARGVPRADPRCDRRRRDRRRLRCCTSRGAGDAGHQVWRAAVALLAAELAFEVGRTVVVDHHLGVDTIALVAMVGALALDEELAGAVIGLMFSGGAALEAAASRRARRELTLLVQRAPRVAQLRIDGGTRGGAGRPRPHRGRGPRRARARSSPSTAPCVSDEAVVDTSTLSGEPLPVTLRAGMAVMSGSANAGGAVRRARRPPRGRERLRRARAARRAGAGPARAVRADGRPLRRHLPADHARSSPAWRGRSAATRCARWPSSSSRRRAR